MGLDIVLATHNQHKVEEFRSILSRDLPEVSVVGYDGPEPVEDGVTFAENALIKARAAAAHTGRIALADDSGIAVDVLGGSPGIFSARWAGPARDSLANLNLLLDQISDMPEPARRGHFVCVIAVVVPAGVTIGGEVSEGWETSVEGIWPGTIATAAQGANGFGYDPIFLPDGHNGLSAAELDPAVKNAESHRARAFEAIVGTLTGLADAG